MARARYSGRRSSRTSRRTIRRKAPRRYVTKKRTYRKRSAVSSKRILNLTSTKKRNTMLSWSNTTNTGASRTNQVGAAIVNGSQGGFFVWNSTAQSLFANGNNGNITINQAERTASSCYMRGLSENIRIQTSSAIPWFHRRICFTTKGLDFIVAQSGDTPINPTQNYVDTSTGIERLWLNVNVNNTPNTQANYFSQIFKGTINQDWNDLIVAPTDPLRITVKFDKTWIITSGNQNGTVKERKLWHPMNKTLVYDDDEAGAGTVAQYVTVDSKAGMGDYMVVDIIQAGSQGTSTDFMSINANSTLYWHEK